MIRKLALALLLTLPSHALAAEVTPRTGDVCSLPNSTPAPEPMWEDNCWHDCWLSWMQCKAECADSTCRAMCVDTYSECQNACGNQ
jgi:hypothetical protein